MGAIIKPVVVLLAICLVISVSLALTFGLTRERIAASETAEADAARTDVFPGAVFEPVYCLSAEEVSALRDFPAVVELYAAKADSRGDGVLGYVATVLAQGYGGEMTVIVGISADQMITGVRISSNTETPGLGANATKPEFYGQYSGKDASAPLTVRKDGKTEAAGDIAAISGATITSRAVTGAVAAAANAAASVSAG